MLQNYLCDALSDWPDNLGLEFMIHKRQSVSFYRIRHPIRFNYSLKDVSLNSVNAANDLGITFDRELYTSMIILKNLAVSL